MAAFVKLMVAHDAQLDAAEMAAEPEPDSEPEPAPAPVGTLPLGFSSNDK